MNAQKFGTVACTALLKALLFVFNLIFFAIGLAFLVIGIYGLKVFKEFFSFAPSTHLYIPIICIGVFMMIVGVLSLWCTPKGVSWLLYFYGVIIFILFLAIFSLSILFMVRRDAFEETLKTGVEKSIMNYPNERESIDILQETIKCCGSHNYTDWFMTNWGHAQRMVPESCCKSRTHCVHQNLTNPANLTDIYQQGCFNKVATTIDSNYILIGGIGFSSALIILLGSVLSCSLAQNLRKNRYEQME